MTRSTDGAAGVVPFHGLDPRGPGAVVARLDRGTGVIDPVRRSVRTGPVLLDRRTYAAVLTSKRSATLLVSRGLGWKRATVPLLHVRDDAAGGVPADMARALADEIEARGVRETTSVVDDLRAHAVHLDSGGSVASSPLALAIGMRRGGILDVLGNL